MRLRRERERRRERTEHVRDSIESRIVDGFEFFVRGGEEDASVPETERKGEG